MRKFSIGVLIFAIPLVLVSLLGELAEPEYGDLFRLARLSADGDYPEDGNSNGIQPEFPPTLPLQRKALVIGDSFVNRGDPLRNFHTHFPDSLTTFVFSSRLASGDHPFRLLQSVRDSLTLRNVGPVDFIVLETVERQFTERLRNISQIKKSQWSHPKQVARTENGVATRLNDGIKFLTSWIFSKLQLSRTGSKKVLNIWLSEHEFVPVYAEDLVFQSSIDTSGVSEQIARLISKAESIFPEAQVRILVCPDKGTFYQNFIENSEAIDIPDWGVINPRVIYPLSDLLDGQNQQLEDLYRYGDTHFGHSGAQIVGQKVFESFSTVQGVSPIHKP